MSRPFRFGLQRVREIRAHDEDQAKERFAASLNARVRGEAVLRAAEDRLRDAQSGVTEPGFGVGGSVSGQSLVARQAWVERLEHDRADAKLRMTTYENDLLHKRSELAKASQAREVLDKLEERQREEHRLESERAESERLDEMALQMFARKQAA
ncbi:flagellar export protein FliJ [Baekduia sp. Peel2402]|uniref:flagellar export protein FliJ n=1 Tax=Baekduia sp. Peel2402 TaxID=3458296 RepID=UPI00403EE9F3